MLEQITSILQRANPNYQIVYEVADMMSIKADHTIPEKNAAYIEEYIKGQYAEGKYRKSKTMQLQIYFSKFVETHPDVIAREELREQIESEIILPFMEEYEKSRLFEKVVEWQIFYTIPQWDANEVTILLQFDCKITRC